MTPLDERIAIDWAPGALIDVSVPAVVAVVPRLRHLLVAFAAVLGADDATLAAVALCVTEAVTNSVRYAYPEGSEGEVRVTADVGDDALEVVVTDEGGGFRPQPGGLGHGLSLIAQSTARFSVDQGPDTGTRVWMRWHLPPAAR